MIRPMLGVNVDLAKLVYPVLGSVKLDGIRAFVFDGIVYSRNGKPIPNKNIQEALKLCDSCDGELIIGEPFAPNVFQTTTSIVMSKDKPITGLKYYVFDCYNANGGILNRIKQIVTPLYNQFVFLVPQRVLNNEEELLQFEAEVLDLGYEGLMLRYPNAEYKNGRSTVKEGALLKLKRFSDSEAIIIDTEELLHNDNEAKTNALGYTERASCLANLTSTNTLGAIIVRDIKSNVEFKIGSGFDAEQRKQFWIDRNKLIGRIIKYKYFTVGVKDKPRFPTFLGFRDSNDMGE